MGWGVVAKILIIEDADPLRNDVIEMLTFEGFDVRGAADGHEGVDEAQKYHPDLIICDIMMPGMDGYEVLSALQKDIETRTIPFIFLTAKTDRADMRYGMGLGADDYLTKPFMANELLETIHARLQRHVVFTDIAEQQVNELSENIITALPHELRTPLNTILGFSDMLAAESSRLKPDEVSKWAQHISEAGKRLNRLMENYLTYARIETLRRDPEKSSELKGSKSMPAVIIQIHAEHYAEFYERADELELDIDNGQEVCISDQDISKITEELIDNAFKFSQKGSKVHVSTLTEGEQYMIRVRNSGRGMSPAQINAVGAYMQFDRFFYEQQGNGLGLIISKRLTELYNGELSISSVPHEQTTVEVRLPL